MASKETIAKVAKVLFDWNEDKGFVAHGTYENNCVDLEFKSYWEGFAEAAIKALEEKDDASPSS